MEVGVGPDVNDVAISCDMVINMHNVASQGCVVETEGEVVKRGGVQEAREARIRGRLRGGMRVAGEMATTVAVEEGGMATLLQPQTAVKEAGIIS
jgi:hypothetical protein